MQKIILFSSHTNPIIPGGTGTSGYYMGRKYYEQTYQQTIHNKLKIMLGNRYDVQVLDGAQLKKGGYTCDLFLSLHCDGSVNPDYNGWFIDGNAENWTNEQKRFKEIWIKGYKPNIRHAPEHINPNSSYFHGYKYVQAPVESLVELGTMTNSHDMNYLMDRQDYIIEMAYDIIVEYFEGLTSEETMDRETIALIFRAIKGVEATEVDYDIWLGRPTKDLIRGIQEDQFFINWMTDFIKDMFQYFVGKDPSQTEIQYWLTKFAPEIYLKLEEKGEGQKDKVRMLLPEYIVSNSPHLIDPMLKALNLTRESLDEHLGSPTHMGMVSEYIYKYMLRREPDEQGLKDNAKDPLIITARGVANTPEFKNKQLCDK